MTSLTLYFYLVIYLTRIVVQITYRSSRLGVFCAKIVLKNFAKFTGKHMCQSLFFNKVAGLRTLRGDPGFCEISKNTFFYRKPPVAASELSFLMSNHALRFKFC